MDNSQKAVPVEADLDLQIVLAPEDSGQYWLPSEQKIHHWIDMTTRNEAVREKTGQHFELSLRIVTADESRALNREWRGKDRPTNVLSFPAGDIPAPVNLLGDLVVCAAVVQREAEEQGKAIEAHWAHMVVHGLLHLLGYDHQSEDQAREMETLETEILQSSGYAAPY